MKPTTVKGKLVFAICGIGAAITLLLDSGEVAELPIHTRDFQRAGRFMFKQVIWRHEYGKMPTLSAA